MFILLILLPLILNNPGQVYILDEDLYVQSTAVVVAANAVTLDLNGHTITCEPIDNNTTQYAIAIPPNYIRKEFFSDINDSLFQGATHFTIKNGTLVQRSVAPAIFSWESADYSNIANININTNGPEAISINYAKGVTVKACSLYSTAIEVDNRHLCRAVLSIRMSGDNATISNNFIIGGPQFGIRISESSGHKILNNIVKHNSYVANAYGIGVYRTKGVRIENNIITPPISGRGIHAEECTNVLIKNNTVKVLERQIFEDGWTHGIKLENSNNINVLNNIVFAQGENSCGISVTYLLTSNPNISIIDNKFTATTSIGDCAAVQLIGCNFKEYKNIFEKNLFSSNKYCILVAWDSAQNVSFKENIYAVGCKANICLTPEDKTILRFVNPIGFQPTIEHRRGKYKINILMNYGY